MSSLVDIFKRSVAQVAFQGFRDRQGLYLDALPGHQTFHRWEVVQKSQTELLVKFHPTPNTERWYTVTIVEKRGGN